MSLGKDSLRWCGRGLCLIQKLGKIQACSFEVHEEIRYVSTVAYLSGQLHDLGALNHASHAQCTTSSRVVTYHRPHEFRENLYSASSAAPTFDLDWGLRWRELVPSPAFLYLWTPGAY